MEEKATPHKNNMCEEKKDTVKVFSSPLQKEQGKD